MSSLLLPTDEAPSAAAAGRRGSGALRIALAVAVAAVLITWLASGVALTVLLRFIAFEALWVVLPGCLLYLLLSPAPGGRLRMLAIGWPLGYAMEVGAFALTAALQLRWALVFLPLSSLVLGGLLVSHGAGRERLQTTLIGSRASASSASPSAPSSRFASALNSRLLAPLALSAAVVLLAFTFFAPYPMPEHVRSVSYSEDNIFDITLAGEARRHWPITESWIAGQPLHYYTGVFQHAAALNQVMGISLAAAFLRLLPSTMFLIAALQLWALGASLERSRWSGWVGSISIALLLMTQDVNLNPLKSQLLQINPFTQFSLSPSFAFGIPFFLGALLLMQTRVVAPLHKTPPSRETPRPWEIAGLLLMVTMYVAGVASAKAFGAFDFVGGLGLYWLWQTVRGKGSRTLTYCVVAAGIAVLIVYFLMIAGGGAATMGVHPLAFLQEGNTLEHATHLAKRIAGSLYPLVLAAGIGVLAPCVLAPLLGAGWLLWRGRGLPASTGLLVSVFLAGLTGYVMLGAPGGVEGVFFVYGYIALVPVAALGLVRLWNETPEAVRPGLLRVGGALLLLGVLIATVSASVTLTGLAEKAWFALAYGSVVLAVVLVVWRLQRRYAVSLTSHWARVVACAIPLLLALALVKPVALAGSGAWKTIVGKRTSLADTGVEYGMTAPLYAGLLWVKAHTTPCDVLAVNNHYDNARRQESVYFYYSAFSERRVFLESWRYTAGGQTGGLPYPGRFALNQRAVAQGNPQALRELTRRGVSYVLIDKTHVGGPQLPASVSTLVFSNSALDVYRLLPAGPSLGCGVVR
ncbi:MAG TPA: hypothetical protein VGY76_02055 [Solirubrobacteraceae bacterium]|jgi:hypothetical protein|nr:hypothetical protein [Solirubrobacteraceae bacterium]